MLEQLGSFLRTALAIFGVYCVRTLWRWRWMRFKQFADFPQPGKPSLVWGHLKLMNEISKKGDPRRHIGTHPTMPGIG